MPQSPILKAKGLYSFANKLSEFPEGALTKASNVVIDRDGVIEPRRGFKIYGESMGSGGAADYAHQLMVYKGRILRHFGSGSSSGTTLEYDNQTLNGDDEYVFNAFNGTYAEVEAGTRIKYLEANGNFYFTTSGGIKKISATAASEFVTTSGYITSAGGVKALDTTVLLDYSQTGFLTQESTVAYRVVWGIRDANNNLILGSPSSRAVIYNPLKDLLIRDINSLLYQLDQSASSGGINDANYLNTYKLLSDDTASTVRSTLINIATKIDADTVITEGAINTASASVTSNVASLVFSSSVATFLEPGDQIVVSGLTGVGTTEDLNGTHTLLSVSTTTVTFAKTHGDFGATGDTGGTVSRNKYTLITQPDALSTVPTSAELEELQEYYDDIVNELQVEPAGITTGNLYTSNNSTQSCITTVKTTIPSGITTAYFYQIYRTALTTSSGASSLDDLDPGDEQGLVYEANPTSTDISNGYISYSDITPESFRGADLYTNTNQEGIAQANEVPPLAYDLALFKGSTFYANTKTKHRKQISLLSVLDLTTAVSTFTIATTSSSNTYTFVDPVAEVFTVQTVADVADSLNGKYFLINSGQDETQYYVWYKTSGGALSDPAVAGRTGVRVDITTGDSANTVATKTRNKLNTLNDFELSLAVPVITFTCTKSGVTTNAGAGNSGFTVVVTTAGVGEDASNKKVVISDLDTPSQQVDETARSLVRVINKNSSENVYAFYLSGPNDVPGLILLENRNLDDVTFYLLTNSSDTGSQFSPDLSPSNTISNISVANPTVITSTSHGLSSTNQIIISGSNSTPTVDGVRTITSTGASTFTVPVNVTVLGSTGGWKLITSTSIVKSDNEVAQNRVYYSKYQQPEAVPILNYFDVGPKDKKIHRVLALRDSLFVLKEDSVYRISGEGTSSFSLTLTDSSTSLAAGDTAAVLNNQIYMYSDKGLVSVSDTGVSIVSRQIEDAIRKLNSPAYTSFRKASWAVGYESDSSYYVWTVTDTSDTKATQCYRYNTLTNTWTNFPIQKTCGVVNPSDQKLYLGAADTNYIEVERKEFSRKDYADRQHELTLSAGSVSDESMTLSSVTNADVGDLLVQTQYLTINQFNRLLEKLDNDLKTIAAPSSYTNYYSTLAASPGDSLRDKVTSLAAKLDTDAGVTDTDYAATISGYGITFADTQDAFNDIVDKLNLDTGVVDTNYTQSSGTIDFEVRIAAMTAGSSQVTVDYALNFIAGPIILYKAIETEVIWAPQSLTDPTVLKQVRESTFLFDQNSFTTATVHYSTDLNPSFEEIDYTADGTGVWGYGNAWGDDYWGGNQSGSPFRTLIPLEKQRCRYIQAKYTHSNAWEKYSLLGNSYTYEIHSSKAYR